MLENLVTLVVAFSCAIVALLLMTLAVAWGYRTSDTEMEFIMRGIDTRQKQAQGLITDEEAQSHIHALEHEYLE